MELPDYLARQTPLCDVPQAVKGEVELISKTRILGE